MYEFIFLGLIPGTNDQLTFELWLKIVGVLLGLWILRRIHPLRKLRTAAIVLSFVWVTHRPVQA